MNGEQAALRSLDGLSVGDAFGENAGWRTTDDTEMACEVVAELQKAGRIDPDSLARRFAARYMRDPQRGYGGGARKILQAIHAGTPWRKAAGDSFNGKGSMGNGGAMRSAPIGAWFAGDPEAVVREARASAEPTHAHPDGQAGAIAVALAAAAAARGEKALIDAALARTPDGETRAGIARAKTLGDLAPQQASRILGDGSQVLSRDTVPLCLWLAEQFLSDYRRAVQTTAKVAYDTDTCCAIVGGIVALRSEIPQEWLAAREPLRF